MNHDVFVYLSGPITARDGHSVEQNVADALAVFLACVRNNIPAFCPQLTGAFPSAHADVHYENWIAYDFAVIDRCTHLLMLPRWETSSGAVREREYAIRRRMPIAESLFELRRMIEKRAWPAVQPEDQATEHLR